VLKMRLMALVGSVAVAVLVFGAAIVGAAPRATPITAALISDIGKFNDRSFNQSQLEGLNRAKAQLGVNVLPLQSNSSSDYLPNLTTAVHKHANLIIAAGFLLAGDEGTVAQQFPNIDFAITDDSVSGGDFKGKSTKNIEGLTYASNEAGCLVGYLAAEMVKKQGGKQVIGAVGGIKIPPVDNYIVGYKFCAAMADPGIKVLVGYSQDFNAQDKCKTVAVNQIGQGSQAEFQVAGSCGLGALNAAAQAGIWGIGVDKDQYNDAKHILTSAIKRVDVGVYDVVKQVKDGQFKGNSDLLFNLKNGGIGVGKIAPSVPASFIAKMNALKAKIISGAVKVPHA
jgi:basic membrane protein A